MNSYRRWNAFITPQYRMAHPLVRLAFNPLAHTTERQLSWLTMAFGGKQMFSNGVHFNFLLFLEKDIISSRKPSECPQKALLYLFLFLPPPFDRIIIWPNFLISYFIVFFRI